MFSDEHTDIKRDAKHCISVRIDLIDYCHLKHLARRLRVRESEVFRFLLRLSLCRLRPLGDQRVTGKALLPMLADCGPELAYHFKLTPERLEALINNGVERPEDRVERDDIELLALAGQAEQRLRRRLQELLGRTVPDDSGITFLKAYLEGKCAAAEGAT